MTSNHNEILTRISGMTDGELDVIASTVRRIEETRKERTGTVGELMRRIESLDGITLLVVQTYLSAAVIADQEAVDKDYCGWLEELKGFSHYHRGKVSSVAPGAFWVSQGGALSEALQQTGEFKVYDDFDEAAEALDYRGKRLGEFSGVTPAALDTVDHLIHWLAVRYPESEAANVVSYYGTKRGRLVHGNLRGYNSWHVLFHESILEEYLHTAPARASGENGPYLPIITLASTGDWDRAVGLCSPRKRKQLER